MDNLPRQYTCTLLILPFPDLLPLFLPGAHLGPFSDTYTLSSPSDSGVTCSFPCCSHTEGWLVLGGSSSSCSSVPSPAPHSGRRSQSGGQQP